MYDESLVKGDSSIFSLWFPSFFHNSRLHSESQFPNHLRHSNQCPDFQKIWKRTLGYLVWTRPQCHSWFLKHLICPVVSLIQHPSQLSIWQCNVLIFRRYGRGPWVIWFGWEDGVTHLWSLRSLRCPRHYNPRNHWILHKSEIYKLSCVIYITKILPNSWILFPQNSTQTHFRRLKRGEKRKQVQLKRARYLKSPLQNVHKVRLGWLVGWSVG